MNDGQLLSRFIAEKDASAFEAILERHGPMVMGVCRRILRNGTDAEDAFQATFLVLVCKAATIRPRGLVGNWLCGVARTTALKARAMKQKRSAKERLAAMKDVAKPSLKEADENLHGALDEELSRLPAKYRSVIVLCELEGRSIKEVAAELGCAPGTVTSRLTRGRRLLADRLSRRGVALTSAPLTLGLAESVLAASPSPALISSTLTAAARVAAAGLKAEGLGGTVAALAHASLKTLFIAKLKLMGGIMSFAAIVTLGVGGLLTQTAVTSAEKSPPKKVAFGVSDSAFLQGAWQAVEAEVTGKKLKKDDAELKGMQFVFLLDDLSIGPVGSPMVRKKKFTLADGESPCEIDMTSLDGVEKGEVARGIYKLEKERLTLCLSVKATSERPKEFQAGAESGMMLFVLERMKK